MPSWHDPYEQPPVRMLEALRDAHARGAAVVGLCLGAFVLGAAGILDGRPATTHWLRAAEFAGHFPAVRLTPDVLYVDDGDVLTSAGGAAGLDCCLHILRKRCGAEIANRVARRLVVAPHRQGSQAQYIEQPVYVSACADQFSGALHWALQTLDAPHTLESLAARAHMSRRTFTRRFRQATGTTTGRWLLGQRLALAQRLLETTDLSIDMVAAQAGFGSAISLRQHFGRAFSTSPSQYRREFHVVPGGHTPNRPQQRA